MYDFYLTREENKAIKSYGKQLDTIYNYQSKQREKVICIYELYPYNCQKSFYGKAKVIETETGRYLLSYETIICKLSKNGTFTKYWDEYSATTMKHIQAFMSFVFWPYGGKKWWLELETGKAYNYNNIVS